MVMEGQAPGDGKAKTIVTEHTSILTESSEWKWQSKWSTAQI